MNLFNRLILLAICSIGGLIAPWASPVRAMDLNSCTRLGLSHLTESFVQTLRQDIDTLTQRAEIEFRAQTPSFEESKAVLKELLGYAPLPGHLALYQSARSTPPPMKDSKPQMSDALIKERFLRFLFQHNLDGTLTLDGKTQKMKPQLNEFGIPFFTPAHARLMILHDLFGASMNIRTLQAFTHNLNFSTIIAKRAINTLAAQIIPRRPPIDKTMAVGEQALINIEEIYFMQTDCANKTRDGKFTVMENAISFQEGTLSVYDIPEIGIWRDVYGRIWTLDHRRLASMVLSGVITKVPAVWVNPLKTDRNSFKFIPYQDGNTMFVTMGRTAIQIHRPLGAPDK